MATTQRLGHYTIIRKLGEGGMGAVYEAVQDGLNRRVALKVLPKHLMKDPTYVERFRREAQASAALKHPNIVTVFEIGEDRGLHYFSMDFIDGESIQARLNRGGRIPVAEALLIIGKVTEALDYAWNHGRIIHRDIKPDNIMTSKEGNVLLADLGLAKSVQENIRLTTTGVPIGSPAFMSPEQAESAKDADCRADIYSLGITFYNMITGELPFKGPTALAVILAHERQPLPDARALSPEVPEGVCEVLQRMCAKAPADRYQTPAELHEALEKLGIPPSMFRQSTIIATGLKKSEAQAAGNAASPGAPLSGLKSGKRGPLIAAAAGGLLVLAVALLLASGLFSSGNSNPPSKDATSQNPTTVSPASTTPPPPAASTTTSAAAAVSTPADDPLKRSYEEAMRFAQDNPEELDGAIKNFAEVEEAAKGTEYAIKAREQKIKLGKVKEARAEFEKLKSTTGKLAKDDRFSDAIEAIQNFPENMAVMLDPEAIHNLSQSVEDRARQRFDAYAAEARKYTEEENFQPARELFEKARNLGLPGIEKAANEKLEELNKLEAASWDRAFKEADKLYQETFSNEVWPLVVKHQYGRALERLADLSNDPRFEALGKEAFEYDNTLIGKVRSVFAAALEGGRALAGKPFSFRGAKGINAKGRIKKSKDGGLSLALDGGGEVALRLEEFLPKELVDLAAPTLKKQGGEGSLALALFWMYQNDMEQGRQAIAEARNAGVDTSLYDSLFAEPAPIETPVVETAAPGETRSFYMGFSTFCYNVTPEAVETTYRNLGENGDLVAYVIDEGIPWVEASEKKPYKSNVVEGVGYKVQQIQKNQQIYLAVSPINAAAETEEQILSEYWGDDTHQPRTGEWKNLKMDDPKVITAYTNFCLDLIQHFQPHTMSYATQVNELLVKQPGQWPRFVNLAKAVHAKIKAKHPNLPLFVTLHVEPFWENEAAHAKAISEILPYTDLIALSTYGGVITRFQQPGNLPKNYFSKLAELGPNKPFAIAESGYIAEDLAVFGWVIEGREEWQNGYMELLLAECEKLHAQFVVWTFHRDFDLFWEPFPEGDLKEFLKIFRDTGLWDGQGRPREALRTWQRWFSRAKT